MSRTPLAFLSYVNLDDQHEQGRLTQFRERLSGEVRMQTGEAFDIFQDRKDIQWGQQWQERLDTSLAAVTFLLPIITPAFFKSTACRAELERFLKREEELERKDLILPVYYVNCPVLKDKEKLKHDSLAQIIAARQYADWRELRFEEFTTPQVRKALANMAEQIVVALERSAAESANAQPKLAKGLARIIGQEAVRRAETTKATPRPERPSKKDGNEPACSANTFQSGGGTQSAALGKGAIGTQNNYYYVQQPQDAKPQPAPTVKIESPPTVVDARNRGYYATITDALKAVKPGTRILVRPGVYKEGILIDKQVEIIGDGNRDDIVIEASGKDVVIFQAGSGRLANLTLHQAGNGERYAVNITKGRLDLEDCDIASQCGSCVAIHNGANPRLRRNRIHDGNDFGIHVYAGGQGTIEYNAIFANKIAGVYITTGSNPTLRRNHIFNNSSVGIRVWDGGGGIFEDNDLRGNARGAWGIAPGCEARVQRAGNLE